ncbi:MAG: hypothetical protein O3B72_01820 [Proteobacteria bacterium]|nr:hypothetical protein [Pseudomonadota bacterium]
MLKNPQIRRFISASCFAGAFIWVAITHFDVDPEVVWVLFLVSFVFVGAMIVLGLAGAPLVRLFNRKSTMLSRLDELSDEAGKAPADGEEGSDRSG